VIGSLRNRLVAKASRCPSVATLHLADHLPRSRSDPPLTLVLDKIAPLPTYVSAYGASGVVTIAVIQSRAQ